jgi:hypothetical protein
MKDFCVDGCLLRHICAAEAAISHTFLKSRLVGRGFRGGDSTFHRNIF